MAQSHNCRSMSQSRYWYQGRQYTQQLAQLWPRAPPLPRESRARGGACGVSTGRRGATAARTVIVCGAQPRRMTPLSVARRRCAHYWPCSARHATPMASARAVHGLGKLRRQEEGDIQVSLWEMLQVTWSSTVVTYVAARRSTGGQVSNRVVQRRAQATPQAGHTHSCSHAAGVGRTRQQPRRGARAGWRSREIVSRIACSSASPVPASSQPAAASHAGQRGG